MTDSIDPGTGPAGDSPPNPPDGSGAGPPAAADPGPAPKTPSPAFRWIYRHPLPVRLAHWINVLCLPILVMSGLQIFNAHPALYWGNRSDRDRAILSLGSSVDESGEVRGVTTVFGRAFDTTGVLGASRDSNGRLRRRGFPGWATIPSFQWLAMGRRWHLFFAWAFVANGILFGLYSVLSRHLDRDLLPLARDLRGLGRAVRDHLRFRHPTGEAAARYNVLQKIAYTAVVFALGPLILLTGLAMSPRMDAAYPFLLTMFGGRQSARTVHFIVCFAFVGYTAAHLFMVAATGLWNNLRSMVAGRYRIEESGITEHES